MDPLQTLLRCVERADAPSQEQWAGLRETVTGCAAQLQQLQAKQAARLRAAEDVQAWQAARLQEAEEVVAAVRQLEAEGVLRRDTVAVRVHRARPARAGGSRHGTCRATRKRQRARA